MKPIVGSQRLENLQEYLVREKPDRSRLKIYSKSTLALNHNLVIKESSDKMAIRQLNEELATSGTYGAPSFSGIVHFHPTRAAFSAI